MATTKHPLQTLLEDNEYDVHSYSGRGMFGKKCIAVTVPDNNTVGEVIRLGFDSVIEDTAMVYSPGAEHVDDDDPIMKNVESIAKSMPDFRWDNMGMQYVMYWPNVPFTPSEDDGDEDGAEKASS